MRSAAGTAAGRAGAIASSTVGVEAAKRARRG